MPYRYIAFTKSGQQVQGLLEVESEQQAETSLWQMDYTIVRLEPTARLPGLDEIFPTVFGARPRDVIIFSRQLATLIGSGVAVMAALELLRDQVTNRAMRRALVQICGDVQTGVTLSQALGKHPLIFPRLYHRMVQVGERTGNLDQILRQVATYMEKDEEVKRRVRGAMAYPAFILLLATGVVFLLLTFTLPAILGLFKEFKAQLPWTTRLLLNLSGFFQAYKVQILAAAVGLVVFLVAYTSRPRGRWQRDWLMLRLPVLGPVNLQTHTSRFCRTMAVLLHAGLPLPEIMDLVLQTTENEVVKDSLLGLQRELLQGRGLSQPILSDRLFPRLLAQMVRVGEETGTLDSNLETLGSFYEDESGRSINTLTSLLEPGLIIFVGGIVGFIALSIIMPMYGLLGAIK
ncbi:MAG: type II secretion system F family protein [Chloroflexota bacterium]